MKFTMFCAEYDGRLILGHIRYRAQDVRALIARTMFDGNWERARRRGWRVVRVLVEKHGP